MWHLDLSSHLATTDMGRKLGAPPPLGEGSWIPICHNVARAETYLRAKFHLDPSNRLATIHQRHRQDRQTTVAQKRVDRSEGSRPIRRMTCFCARSCLLGVAIIAPALKYFVALIFNAINSVTRQRLN